MAIDLCVDGFDDENGGDAPLIRELDLHDLASRMPQDLLEPSQPSTGHTLLTTLPPTHCHKLLQ